jgi:hypothetical protein
MIESDSNPFPEINLGLMDRAKELGKRLIGLCSYYPPDPEVAYPSEHRRIRGAAELLDYHLADSDGEALEGYAEVADQLLLPFDKDVAVAHYVALAQEARQHHVTEGWDDMGNYFSQGVEE